MPKAFAPDHFKVQLIISAGVACVCGRTMRNHVQLHVLVIRIFISFILCDRLAFQIELDVALINLGIRHDHMTI